MQNKVLHTTPPLYHVLNNSIKDYGNTFSIDDNICDH